MIAITKIVEYRGRGGSDWYIYVEHGDKGVAVPIPEYAAKSILEMRAHAIRRAPGPRDIHEYIFS